MESFGQRVHVGIWYIVRAQRGSHIPTLRLKYTPYSYIDPLGWLGGAQGLHDNVSWLTVIVIA